MIYTLCTRQGAPSGYATIVILICFMFAMLFVIVGIIGEYIAILFSELRIDRFILWKKPGIWKARGGSNSAGKIQARAEESFEKSLIKIRKSLLKNYPNVCAKLS